jgi:acyl-coenzyme A synthetase/AMP-(fatty) acid ligase
MAPDHICRIILTSGSTGDPKAIAFSHEMLADRIARHMVVFGSRLPNCSRIYCDLPVSTAIGFRFLLFTLWRGGIFFFPGDTFESTVDAFEEYQTQCILSSPGGLEVLLKAYESYPTLQSELELVVVPGNTLPKPLANRLRARVCSNVITVYGATETTTTASAPVHMLGDTPGAVGFVAPGVEVEIVDEAGNRVASGVEGHVRIKSRYAVKGYIGDPQASAKTFRDGWFYPGDIGALDKENLLRIIGRQDSVLNLGGDKINPETIERAVVACEGVVECATFGLPNELGIDAVWVAVVADARLNDEKLYAHCAATLPQFLPAGFVRLDRLPRNDMGKIDRRQLPELMKKTPA